MSPWFATTVFASMVAAWHAAPTTERINPGQDVTEQILQNRVLPSIGFAEGRDTWDNFVFRRHVG